jgi:hypothetical protein
VLGGGRTCAGRLEIALAPGRSDEIVEFAVEAESGFHHPNSIALALIAFNRPPLPGLPESNGSDRSSYFS